MFFLPEKETEKGKMPEFRNAKMLKQKIYLLKNKRKKQNKKQCLKHGI